MLTISYVIVLSIVGLAILLAGGVSVFKALKSETPSDGILTIASALFALGLLTGKR